MNYEKKYKALLEQAKEELKTCGSLDCDAAKQIFRFFPELAENADERIRKDIIAFLKENLETGGRADETWSISGLERWIAWLEKQGEKNPTADKVEPKFKVGDWVVINNKHQSIYQVEKIEDGYYTLRHTYGGTFRECVLHDESLRLWTIQQDAKDGDVLARNNDMLSICIFAHFSGINNRYSSFLCHCGLEDEGLGQELSINGYHDDCKDYVPAAKEQRDTLFAKMKEVGYEWDSQSKQILRIN